MEQSTKENIESIVCGAGKVVISIAAASFVYLNAISYNCGRTEIKSGPNHTTYAEACKNVSEIKDWRIRYFCKSGMPGIKLAYMLHEK